MSRRELVERMLQDAGPSGVTTSQFLIAGAGSRFGARIQELRDAGRTIPCTRVRDGEYRYVLAGDGPIAWGWYKDFRQPGSRWRQLPMAVIEELIADEVAELAA